MFGRLCRGERHHDTASEGEADSTGTSLRRESREDVPLAGQPGQLWVKHLIAEAIASISREEVERTAQELSEEVDRFPKSTRTEPKRR